MREPLYRTLALILLAGSCALAQNPPVPATYQATYTELQNDLNSFNATITSQWNGKSSNVLWSGELLSANANAGLILRNDTNGARLELKQLHALGLRSVVVNIASPILNEDFYTFNGDPGDFQPMVAYYANLANQIHKLGLKMVVESAIMFTGSFSAGSGFNLTGYYASLSDNEFVAARVKNILTIAQQVGPDYINLNSEPDTDAFLSGKTSLYGTPAAFAAMNQTIISQLRGAGVTIPLGAGVGTWLDNGAAWVTALLKTGIDFLDLHVYPVNFNCLPALITYADMAKQAGKPVGIAEAWLLKESDSEFQNPAPGTSVAGGAALYARDPFSFWAPLDQAFLTDLHNFANWKGLLYVSPFWSKYFWAYLDYNVVANLSPAEVTTMENAASNAALVQNQMTGTATDYRTNTGGILQVPLVSAADFLTTPQAPNSMVTIFGSNLSTGTANATSLPLPTTLANTTATIQDSSGKQEPVPFIYVSPTQINAAIPPGLSNGVAIITISIQGTVVGGANVIVNTVAPSLFTANKNGQGAPVGVVVTANASGAESSQSTYEGKSVGNYTPAPINLGQTGEQSVLVLYGTGIRGVTSLAYISATIGNVNLPVQYAGPCDPNQFVAFDQVNLSLPQSLAGAGQVSLTLTVNGVAAPPVTLDFQ
jgi:uncharacterized protein (TIGR03437 family)